MAAKKSTTANAAMMAAVEAQAKNLIETVLKPKHVLPPISERFNYISDIGAKWVRNYFYFIATYTCPRPDALSPTFEAKFVRLEPLSNTTFALSAMRHTGQWVGVHVALSLEECMKSIEDEEWFTP